MPHLLDAIEVVPDDEQTALEPEDIFAAAPGFLFPDDLVIVHGDPSSTIVYRSQRFGAIRLRTAEPVGEVHRRLFAHYVWNASIGLAGRMAGDGEERGGACEVGWSVADETVLELGAGTGLAGIIALLAGAKQVVLTDYPEKTLLSTIEKNAYGAVPSALRDRITIAGYAWGDVTSPFARMHAGRYTRILAAELLWVPGDTQIALADSLHHLLRPGPTSRAFVVAGLHTGRGPIAAFFAIAEARAGLVPDVLYEEDATGVRRAWEANRPGEDVSERKRWQVFARLRWRDAM